MMCYRPCKQCLSSTRRSIQQHTLLPQEKVSIVRLHSQASKREHSSKSRAKQHAHYQKTKPFQMHELSSSQSSLTRCYMNCHIASVSGQIQLLLKTRVYCGGRKCTLGWAIPKLSNNSGCLIGSSITCQEPNTPSEQHPSEHTDCNSMAQ